MSFHLFNYSKKVHFRVLENSIYLESFYALFDKGIIIKGLLFKQKHVTLTLFVYTIQPLAQKNS